MREVTCTALTPDPAQPLTVDSLIEQLRTFKALGPMPEALELTRAEWAALRATPEVARIYRGPHAPDPDRFWGLPIRVVDNPITARLHRDWARVFGPVDNRVHRGEGDGRVQERQGQLPDRESGQADGAGDPGPQ